MIDYNTETINEHQRHEANDDKAILDWEASHGVALPLGMDMEQAEEYLSNADDWGVDIKKPWFYQSRFNAPLDGAFNLGKEMEYLIGQVDDHGIDWFYRKCLRDSFDLNSDSDILFTLFGENDPIDALDFLKQRGFKQWPLSNN